MPFVHLLAAAFLSAKAPISAPQWTPVTMAGAEGNQRVYFVNRSSLKRRGEQVELQMTMIPQLAKGGVHRVVERTVADCSARSALTVDVRFHGRNDRLISTIAGDGKVQHFTPGSAMDLVLGAVCEDSLSEAETNDPQQFAQHLFGVEEVALNQR